MNTRVRRGATGVGELSIDGELNAVAEPRQVPGLVEAEFSRSDRLASVVQGLVLDGWDQPELAV